MTKCAAIAVDDARHACADDVMRNAGLLSATKAEPAEHQKTFGLQSSAPNPAPRPASGPAPALQQKEETQLEVTLAAVEQGGDGKLVLTTTEGAVWRQVEHITIFPPPQQGQTLTILRNSFGGFMCKPSKWVTFRCYRTR